MNAKAKGTRNEHRSARILEAAGYAVTRAAASLGAWDLIGIGPVDVVLCQVKSRDWPGLAGRSFSREPDALAREIEEELADVCGWSFILWARVRGLRDHLGSDAREAQGR